MIKFFVDGTTATRCMMATLVVVLSLSGNTRAVYSQTQDTIVAVVDGRKFTQDDVDRSVTSQLFPLQQQMYAIRKAALENLILRTVLENEAAKQGKSVEELKRQLTAGRVEVLASEVEQLYADNAAAFAAMSSDEAKQRLELDLESQARMQNYRDALLKLRAASTIEVLLEEPRLPSLSDDLAAPSKGPGGAIVTITEFSDFLCPYCRNSQAVVKQILQGYKNEVRLVFKHLPLDIHAQAFPAAQAAFCAGEQGFFWQYHDALFAATDFSPEALNRIAATNSISMPEFKACLSSPASRAAVLKDTRAAKQLGIDGTPAFIVNGKLIRGAISFEEFKAIIEGELKFTQHTTRTSRP